MIQCMKLSHFVIPIMILAAVFVLWCCYGHFVFGCTDNLFIPHMRRHQHSNQTQNMCVYAHMRVQSRSMKGQVCLKTMEGKFALLSNCLIIEPEGSAVLLPKPIIRHDFNQFSLPSSFTTYFPKISFIVILETSSCPSWLLSRKINM